MSEEKKASNSKTPIYKKWWFWVIIVVVILAIGGAASNSDKEPKKVDEGASETTANSSEENKTFKVGDTVAIDDREMTVTDVKRNYTPKYLKPGEGKEYVLVKIEFSNKSDDTVSWYSNEWKMEDSNGAIESSAVGANDESDILNYGELAAGGKKAGSIVFEVPKDDQNLKIHYQPQMFGSREAVIEL